MQLCIFHLTSNYSKFLGCSLHPPNFQSSSLLFSYSDLTLHIVFLSFSHRHGVLSPKQNTHHPLWESNFQVEDMISANCVDSNVIPTARQQKQDPISLPSALGELLGFSADAITLQKTHNGVGCFFFLTDELI